MHILVMNDDGYQAPGIAALAAALGKIAKITVVAPDKNHSGASNSLTLNRSLRVAQAENGFYHVDGTPTDCAYLALTALLDKPPDLVVSGINTGANLGDMVIYSGTVAAAMEAYFLGVPAIAISLAGHDPRHYATAGAVAVDLAKAFARAEALPAQLVNVNVPDLAPHDILGFRATRLGRRRRNDRAEADGHSPNGEPAYRLATKLPGFLPGEGTDVEAIQQAWISVTPLTFDMTDDGCLYGLAQWLGAVVPSPAGSPVIG